MRFKHDGIEVWYETEDAPAPSGLVSVAKELFITIGVHPADAGNRVEIQYRLNGGATRSIEARWFKNDLSAKRQYFRAQFSQLREGDAVEYWVICRSAGRQAPASNELKNLSTSFRVTGSPTTQAGTSTAITPDRPTLGDDPVPRVPIRDVPVALPPPISFPPTPVPPPGPAGLQTADLIMLGLPIIADHPPNRLQPRLIDGIHFRWAFKRDLGFPLYGFYVFRRGSLQGDPICLSSATGNLSDGPYGNVELSTPVGTVSSDQLLVLTDLFPRPPGQTIGGFVEFDLKNRSYLLFTLPNGNPARRATVRIGFTGRADLTVSALLWGVTVLHLPVSGKPG